MLSPLARQIFPKEIGNCGLDERDFLAFVVHFRPSANSMDGVVTHIDESIVTFSINSKHVFMPQSWHIIYICIGHEFTGGQLEFECDSRVTIEQQIGKCVVYMHCLFARHFLLT